MANRYDPARHDDRGFATLGPIAGDVPLGPPGKLGPFGMGPFIRPTSATSLEAVVGQWGMIRPGSPTRRPPPKEGRPVLTNNARSETIAKLPTFRAAWAAGQRCIIPAWSYDYPNWETGKNVWWTLRRADGQPWGIAGLWSAWTDPDTGEIVASYTMPTINVEHHELLRRFHRPDPRRPAEKQDKRGIVALEPADWRTWLFGSNERAAALLHTLPVDAFDARPSGQ